MGMPASICNVPADGSSPAFELAQAGVHIVRIVPLPQYDMRRYFDELHDAGVKVLVVGDHDILGDDPGQWSNRWNTIVNNKYEGRYDFGQPANEPDQPGSASSWEMGPDRYGALLRALRHVISVPMIGGGLVSGDPSWLARVPTDALRLLDGFAVHPYGQRAEPDWPNPSWGFGNVAELLSRYVATARILAMTQALWVTEVGFSSTNRQSIRRHLGISPAHPHANRRDLAHPDVLHPQSDRTRLTLRTASTLTSSQAEQFQAEYCERMMIALSSIPGLVAGGWFAWHDFEGFGLVADDGRKKPALAAFSRAVASRYSQIGPLTPPRPENPPESPQYKLGFLDFYNAAPALLGKPLENEDGGGIPGLSYQETERCILTAAKLEGVGWTITAFEKATRQRWLFRGGQVVKLS